MASSEIWKTVPNFDRYEVSNFGNVRSKKRIIFRKDGETRLYQSKLLKPQKTHKGYMSVSLYDENGIKVSLIHRIVADAFLPNTCGLPQINHKDGNKENNNVSNLEWCDNRHNQNHAVKNHLRKKLKRVVQYDKQGNYLATWETATEASKALKIDVGHIGCVCRNERKTAGSFMWRYEETL